MVEPPPRDPDDPAPADDETVVVPPDRSVDDTVISDAWGPESDVFVEEALWSRRPRPCRRSGRCSGRGCWRSSSLCSPGSAPLYFTQQDETTVPAVTGMRQEAAETAVRDAGLEPETTRQESSKPAGLVLGQNPDAGAKVDEGSTVRLVVSTGPPRETVPDVVGETQSQAVAALTAAGFENQVTEAFSDKKAGVVVSQKPERGREAGRGRHGHARRLEGQQAGDRARRGRHDLVGGDVEARGRRAQGQRRRRPIEQAQPAPSSRRTRRPARTRRRATPSA